jgi:oligoribonuclease NrnB/cAMP/cGMP phosphodiesterase (DHH superfamily)
MKCFYHKADLDGKCSAAIVRYFRPKAELIGIDYCDKFPWHTIEDGEQVYMVDFCLQPFSDMLVLRVKCDLCWIDHHLTAIEESNSFNPALRGVQLVGYGACQLTWEVFSDKPLPLAVRYLANYDVWDHKDPNTVPFQYGLRLADTSPHNTLLWKELFEHNSYCHPIIKDGHKVLCYCSQENNIKAKALCFRTELDGLKIIAANHGPASSQFFDSVSNRNSFDAMCLFFWGKNRWEVRLYTNKVNINVGAIAKKYGGGGHQKAAGFGCEELPFSLNYKK